MDWNDLRYFIAVAETGSTLAAGSALRVSQTTAARRVASLEQALGVSLFERRSAGYRLTERGKALLPFALDVAGQAGRLVDAAAASRRDASGTVRLSVTDIYAATVLTPILHALHDEHGLIRIELDTTDVVRDLASGEADIALRSCVRPSGAGLVGRRVGTDNWAVYCSQAMRPSTDSRGGGKTCVAIPSSAAVERDSGDITAPGLSETSSWMRLGCSTTYRRESCLGSVRVSELPPYRVWLPTWTLISYSACRPTRKRTRSLATGSRTHARTAAHTCNAGLSWKQPFSAVLSRPYPALAL